MYMYIPLFFTGVVARDPQYYSYLKDLVTEKVVAERFKEFLEPSEDETIYDLVTRYFSSLSLLFT